MEIHIDDREKAIIEEFDNVVNHRPTRVVKTRLTIADIGIYYGKNLLIAIERKTWNDLAASIKDGRINNQISDLCEVRKNNPDVTVLILIEGKRCSIHQGIDIKNLDHKIYHTIIRNNIPFVYSKNIHDSCKIIATLSDTYPSDMLKKYPVPDTENGEVISGGDGPEFVDPIKVKRIKNYRTNAINALSAVPGISHSSAEIILRHFSIMQLMKTATVEEISKLQYVSGKKFGDAKAEKLLSDIKTGNCIIKMLEEINGMKRESATSLFAVIGPDPGSWSIKTIKDVKKTEKRKIGKKIATRIMESWNFILQ